MCRLEDSSKNLQSSEMGQSQVAVSDNSWRAQDQHQSEVFPSEPSLSRSVRNVDWSLLGPGAKTGSGHSLEFCSCLLSHCSRASHGSLPGDN